MKENKLLVKHSLNIFRCSLVLMLISIVALYMSFAAVDVAQEYGKASSILGYNRGWLVAYMPYFIASLGLSVLLFFYSLYRFYTTYK